MNIIYEKSKNVNSAIFYQEALNNSLVNGIFLNINASSDNQIIVINKEQVNNLKTVNYTLEYLKSQDIISLDEALTKLNNTNKKIVLDLQAINLYDTTEQNLEEIIKQAMFYINTLNSIIRKYPKLNIYLCSRIHRTIYILQNSNLNRPIGLIVTPDNLTYIDVEFYVFNLNNLNPLILIQQIDLRKELMLHLPTKEDINRAKNYFDKDKMTQADKLIYKNFQFITEYPNTLYEELN